MSNWRISRRTMLRGVGAAVALPMLDVMEPALADTIDTKPVSRVAYLYIPNGVARGAWTAEKVSANGQIQKLNDWMAPLEAFKDDIVLPRNMWTPRGNGHGAGTATWLTGSGFDGRKLNVGATSADQMAAQTIGKETLLPSIELSSRGEGFFSGSLVRNAISWRDSQTPMPRDTEPRVVFDRMFRQGGTGASDRSILDSILEDAKSMRLRVSNEDQRKIDEYLESIRSIERRLEFADKNSAKAAANRALMGKLKRPPAGIPEDHGLYLRTMFDVVTLAFWSDATRVCSFMLDHGQSNRYFNFIDGVQGTWHALSHWRDASGNTEDDDGKTSWSSVTEKRAQYNRVVQWHHQQVAHFLGRLKEIREPDGKTLLENSMVMYGSNLADGHAHGEKNLPILLAGGGGGTIKTGRQIKFRKPTSMSKLHLSLLQRLGVPTLKFGETADPLTELDA